MMRRLFRKIYRRRRLQQDLEQELAFHREMAAQHENGIPLGNTSLIKEHAFDILRFNFVENLGRDLLFAARGFQAEPGSCYQRAAVARVGNWCEYGDFFDGHGISFQPAFGP